MLREKHRIDSVLVELTRYVLTSHPTRVAITIDDLGDRVSMTVQTHGARISRDECQLEQALLNAPAREEVRAYYGALAGEETLGSCDLRVAAMMVDGGTVEPQEDGVRIVVWWKTAAGPREDERHG